MPDRPDAIEPPQRIQRKRTKGWRMPPGVVYVGRPTKRGNPIDWRECRDEYGCTDAEARAHAVAIFRDALTGEALDTHIRCTIHAVRRQLRGKSLACFCPLDQPCHADVLLELANDGRAVQQREASGE